jgi:hypothetical protein
MCFKIVRNATKNYFDIDKNCKKADKNETLMEYYKYFYLGNKEMKRFREYIGELFTKVPSDIGYNGKVRGKFIDVLMNRKDRGIDNNLARDSLGGDVRLSWDQIGRMVDNGKDYDAHDKLVQKHNFGGIKLKKRHIDRLIDHEGSYGAHEGLVRGMDIGRVKLDGDQIGRLIKNRDSAEAHIGLLGLHSRGKVGLSDKDLGDMIRHGNRDFDNALVRHNGLGHIGLSGEHIDGLIKNGDKGVMEGLWKNHMSGRVDLGDRLGMVKDRGKIVTVSDLMNKIK